MLYIDFHTHKYRAESPTIEVASIHPGKQFADGLYTVGYHPWWAHEQLTIAELNLLRDKLVEDPKCLALGECGLDKLKGTNKILQNEIFGQQIALANELGAPLIVHCVRMYDDLLQWKKSINTKVVVHGFIRNKILAKSLLDAGFLLSIAPSGKMSQAFTETIKYLPDDRFFIETDSSIWHNIEERYAIAAQLRQTTVENLQKHLFNNFNQFFSWKWNITIG